MSSRLIAGFLLVAALTSSGASMRADEQAIKPTRPGKQETLSAEQKRRIIESSQRAFQLRKTERPQLLKQLQATEQRLAAAEHQALAKENVAIRAQVSEFRSPAANARYDAIEREARELWQRAQKATAAEREAIDRRAAQLLEQLRGRPQGSRRE